MDFHFTEDQKLFCENVARFAQRELAADAVKRANAEEFPWDIAKKMAANGLIGISFPEEIGGMGGTLMDCVIAIEQVALSCPRSADVVQAGNFGAIRTFVEYGTPGQRERFLPSLLSGETVISVAMSEPDAGSAVTELTTAAKKDGNGYRLKGSKVFGTNSTDAALFLVYCRFGPGTNGIGSVLVPRDAEGIEFGAPTKFTNGEAWQPIFFDDVFVPDADVLLPAGGFKKQITGFNAERLGNAARALAVGQHAFNVAKEHALVRTQFGRTLSEFQGIQWKFADAITKLEAARLLLYRAAASAGNGLPDSFATSVAKLACNRAGFEVSNEAMQVLGALGFSEESIVQYCVGRTRGWMIAGGSIEMMQNRIAEHVFGRRFPQRVE